MLIGLHRNEVRVVCDTSSPLLPPVYVTVDRPAWHWHDYLTTEEARAYALRLLAAAIEAEGTE